MRRSQFGVVVAVLLLTPPFLISWQRIAMAIPVHCRVMIAHYEVSGQKISGRRWDADGSFPDVYFRLGALGHGVLSNLKHTTGSVHRDRLKGTGAPIEQWSFVADSKGSVVLYAYDKDMMSDDFIGKTTIATSGPSGSKKLVLSGGEGSVEVTAEWSCVAVEELLRHAREAEEKRAAKPTIPKRLWADGWSTDGKRFGYCGETAMCRGTVVSHGRKPTIIGKVSTSKWSEMAIVDGDRHEFNYNIGKYKLEFRAGYDGWELVADGPDGLHAVIASGSDFFGGGFSGGTFFPSPTGEYVGFGAADSSEAPDGGDWTVAVIFHAKRGLSFAMNRQGLAAHKIGKYAEAAKYYTAALEIAPGYRISRYNRACAYALMHDVEHSVDDMRILLAADYKKFSRKIRKDPDFDAIRVDPRFSELLR